MAKRKARRKGAPKGKARRAAKPAARASAPGPIPRAARTVRDLMTRRPVSLDPDAPLDMARAKLLWSPFRHLPVVEDGAVVGILSDRDLLTAITTHGRSRAMDLKVREVMRRDVHTLEPDAPVERAAELMVARAIGSVPVVDGGKLVGIVTAKDVLGEAWLGPVSREITGSRAVEPVAREVMTEDPIVVRVDEPLPDALSRMAESGIRHLPVVDAEGRLIGMLSDRDVRAVVGDPREALRRARPWEVEPYHIADVMRPDPVGVELDAPWHEIADVIADERVGAVPVVDEDEHPVGIVSYVDLLATVPH